VKTVVVTGGTRGLGLAIVREVAAEGYRAVAVARKPTAELDSLREAFPGCVEFVAFDLPQLEGVHGLVGEIVNAYGRPWALVNNAAVAAPLHPLSSRPLFGAETPGYRPYRRRVRGGTGARIRSPRRP
jgi:NAD(P)-dependent dehydrogenase (short-subunit alcohol dehydrogenase family)